MKLEEPRRRAALIIGHPGHELRLLGWCQRNKPDVFIITDGSGLSGISRFEASVDVIGQIGGRCPQVSPPMTDAKAYAALLTGDFSPIQAFFNETREALLQDGVSTIVCDGFKGFNPTHDVCYAVTARLVEAVAANGIQCEAFSFPLAEFNATRRERKAISLALTEAEFEQKIRSAGKYFPLH